MLLLLRLWRSPGLTTAVGVVRENRLEPAKSYLPYVCMSLNVGALGFRGDIRCQCVLFINPAD